MHSFKSTVTSCFFRATCFISECNALRSGYIGSKCPRRTTADQLRVVGITVPQPKVRDQIYLRLRKDPEALLRRSMPVEEHASPLPEALTHEKPLTGEQDNLTLRQDLAEEGKEPRVAEAEINLEAVNSVESKSGSDENRTSNADQLAKVESGSNAAAMFDIGLAKEIDEDTMLILAPGAFDEDIMMNDVMQADVVQDEIVQDEIMQDATAMQNKIVQDEVMQDIAATQDDAAQSHIQQYTIVPNLVLEELKG
ncbi:hypothetical protein HETIRDRAFT_166823 [Heterobasidion irregulare TC 32-1]|uniref:Uncharacterized protein n=1 Tax=Heterobasidion irregulare (strain TC 32-1) TaxID=747525 RepID=W4KQH7_HETIT|nr:uncharacterized protein HETIRDRAFT_166823 [Heterobasidion irregulare TC 32-1]ETW87286.1 hypothetical protein HETIRDRAFT_166823 [Heterobasidion irregulare TC 32-1]